MDIKKPSFLNFPLGDKKASTDLSVSGIVTIILAIVFLGLSLMFLRGTFTETGTKFNEQVSTEQNPPDADADNPISFSREKIITKAGSDEVLKVNIFNPTNKDWMFSDTETLGEGTDEEVVRLKVDCLDGLNIEKVTSERKVRVGATTEFSVLLKIDEMTAEGSYICKLEIERDAEDVGEYAKDLTIEIE